MQTIKITSKRQATFPIELCRDMGIGPGDELVVKRHFGKGEFFWALHPGENKFEWMGALKKYAQHKSHDIQKIRESIGRAGKK